jgi:ABC-type multidrug transport system, ATPase and permease components
MKSFIKKLRNKTERVSLPELWQEIKWMFHYIRRYKIALAYYIIMGAIGTVVGLSSSVASKYLIDAVTGHKTSELGFIILFILGSTLGGIAIGAATSRISAKINLKVNNEIQSDIYDQIMRVDWEALCGYHSGDLLNRLSGDTKTVADSVIGWLPTLITNLIQFIGTLAIILYYDPTMAVIALLSAPVTLLMSRLLVSRMRSYNKMMRQVSSDIMAFNEESFQNVLTIKSFDLVSFFVERLRNIQKYYSKTVLDYNKFSIYTSSFMSIIGIIVSYSTFGWGVFRLWSGSITFGTMTLFLQLSGGLSKGFSSLVGMVPSALNATTSAGRIMAIVGLAKEEEVDVEQADQMRLNTIDQGLTVQLAHADINYRGKDQILKNVNIKVKPKEIVAIIGPSGEGKTTLIRVLLGLLKTESGVAKIIDNNGLETRISAATRKFFSYVPQGNTIFSGTIAYNMRMVKPEASDEEIILALKAACAYEFVKDLPEGINTHLGEKGGGFSEGQAQRIAIARAILREAPILLLDEATSALDIETEKKVLQNIIAYGKKHSCILTTHRESVLAMCDKIYQISDSRVKECEEEFITDLAANF